MREKISEMDPQEKAERVIQHIGAADIRKLLSVFRAHHISEIGVDTEQGHVVVTVEGIERELLRMNQIEAGELFSE